MIIQPERGTRNVNEKFYEMETRQIAMLNEIFGEVELTKGEMRTLVWLAGWGGKHSGKCGARNTKSDSGGSKAAGAAAPSVGRISSRQGAKAAFDGRNGCRKCFCVTFDESNKAYAPYPALITTRQGRKESY
ncbi:hypothetical protein [Blautia sp. An81]|uniref:hypothetical protein n=1 Tax=Blautia sp. An81 TaxID=1965659 RepID=UPI001FA8C450|nr:hypothetical protein [Blautia sp. An81]